MTEPNWQSVFFPSTSLSSEPPFPPLTYPALMSPAPSHQGQTTGNQTLSLEATDILQRTNPALSPGLFASPMEVLRKTWAQASSLESVSSLWGPKWHLHPFFGDNLLHCKWPFGAPLNISINSNPVGNKWQQVREEDHDYHPTAAEGAKWQWGKAGST